MVKLNHTLMMRLEDLSDKKHRVRIYTGGDDSVYSGWIIHVGNDYIAMGHDEGKNVFSAIIPLEKITLVEVVKPGKGMKG